ncbi:MAG: NADPH-dependent FMN reductase [Ignavibacteria bacterium]
MTVEDKELRILAISGSLKSSSSNSSLVRAIGKLFPQKVEYIVYGGLGTLPHFSPDIDGDNSPPAVKEFRSLLKSADGIVICTPEYAFGVPGVLKNALDWTVSTGDFYEIPAAVISASPLHAGGNNAHASLMLTMKAMQASITEKAKLMIGSINKKIAGDEITDGKTKEKLISVVNELLSLVREKPKPVL